MPNLNTSASPTREDIDFYSDFLLAIYDFHLPKLECTEV